MSKKQIREIIRIDETLCNGCGECLPNCPEGAIQMIEGKARLVSDLFCDGLGACLGHCPTGAITIEKREAELYDERSVIENIVKQGPAVVAAHLEHLREHGETAYLAEAREYLASHGISATPAPAAEKHCACPGSTTRAFKPTDSALSHWPIQMHLINPMAGHFRGSDLVLAADCVAFSLGAFHSAYLKGKTLAIACPKLDDGQEIYRNKLQALIEHAQIRTLTIMLMEVPCCRGLERLALDAMQSCTRKVAVQTVVVGVDGRIRETTE